MKKSNDLLLYRDRRSRSLQDWSKSGGKKLYDRFLRQAKACDSRNQGSGHRGLSDDKEVNDSSITNGNSTIDEPSYDSGDEELDLIVSSWKQNFYYFQREQAKRAAASSEQASTTMETFDGDEDSILMAILGEDESFYEDNYEEEDFDDNTMYDERTVFSLATHEESEFQEFVLQYEQRRRARPFLERFMEVLGITDEEEDEDVASISEATHQSISPLQCSQTAGNCPEQQKRKETQRPIGWEGEQILATEEHLESIFSNLALKEDEDRARSLCVEQTHDEGSIKTRHASHVPP